jgi:hypothetical protein
MAFPKHLIMPAALWGTSAAAVVVLSSLVMTNLERKKPNMALALPVVQQPQQLGAIDQLMVQPASMVSQNATAPEASADMPAVTAELADTCDISLELLDEGDATIGGTLLAPCLPSQDLVIAHAGMVFSAKTLASGGLFFSLPALKTPAEVDIRFSTGEEAKAQLDMPDVVMKQRVVMQWPFVDGFGIHAFENGAEFGSVGHIWAENPSGASRENPQDIGNIIFLGDTTVAVPLMAQVFTYGHATSTDVIIEASVTQENCEGELSGDVITANAGTVEKTALILAMPPCDAVGEFVHLGLPNANPELALSN